MGLLNSSPEEIIARLIVVLIAMTVHEFAHSFIADRMGDPTPRSMGRLTLNPFVHIHWLGFLMFALVGFGILGTAPISPWRMRNPRWGTLAAVAAGPISNLLLAIVAAIIFHLLPNSVLNGFGGTLIFTMISFNVLLFVFNLIPLSPLDGWTVVLTLLPPDLAEWWNRNRQTSQLILFGLILFSFVGVRGIPDPLGLLISGPTNAIIRLLIQ